MHTPTTTAADRARVRFIERAIQIAASMGSTKVMDLADAALQGRDEPASYWAELTERLTGWHRAQVAGDDCAPVLFSGIAGTLRTDARWTP